MRISRVFTIFSKVVLAIGLVSKVVTPDAWTALKSQAHVPARIGTAPFDQVLSVTMMSLLYVWTVIIIVRVGRKITQSDAMGDAFEDALDALGRRLRRRPTRQSDYLESLERRFAEMKHNDDEAPLFELLVPYRESIIDGAVRHWVQGYTDLEPQPQCFVVAANGLPFTTDIDSRLTRVNYEWGSTSNSFGIAALAERLGGRYVRPHSSDLANVLHHYVVWDEPMTAYRMTQFRLYCSALELVMCTSAGKTADALHETLAAECRLASYQGFVLGGSNDPLEIERAVMSECRDITALDALVSAPEFELDAA